MHIQCTADGRNICGQLLRELNKMKYNPELYKILRNIEKMVTDVSIKEVVCRRRKNWATLSEPLDKLNSAVDHLEKLILIAKLIE